MKVLVTGGTGFLGRHLVPALRDEGHDVIALSRIAIGPGTVAGDVLDPESLQFEGCDAVVHAAGGVSHTPDDAGWMWEVHVKGTQNVLDAAKAAGVRRVVHLSSSGTIAVGKDPVVLDEHAPAPTTLVADWPYYRAKLYAEQAALGTKGLEVVCLNPSLLLGPGDVDRKSVRAVESHTEGWLRGIPPGGLSFVDVRDVATAVGAALTRGAPGRRYLLGAANWSFAEFYQRLSRITGLPLPMMRLPRVTSRVLGWIGNVDITEVTGGVDRWELELACHFWYCDARRARAELGWEARDPGETLADTVEDLRGRATRRR